jgi:hypothetical protein
VYARWQHCVAQTGNGKTGDHNQAGAEKRVRDVMQTIAKMPVKSP